MGVTFGTAQSSSGSGTSPSLALTGLTSGQPIVLFISADAVSGDLWYPTAIEDTSGMTWTEFDAAYDPALSVRFIFAFIGTGGNGATSTTISATFGSAVPWTMQAVGCIGATSAVGAAAIQTEGSNNGVGTTISSPSVTPLFTLGGAVYACRSGAALTSEPSSPWTSTVDGSGLACISLYPSPPLSPLSTTWDTGSSQTWVALGVIVGGFTAPSPPTLQIPANASYEDVTGVGVTLGALYNATDGLAMSAYALRIKTSGGSYLYWNAGTSALQSGIVWNPLSVAVGATWSITLPSGVLTDGNVYNWSMASEESGESLTGSFASDDTFTAQAAPSLLTVTAPTGTVNSTNEPAVTWTVTFPGGASQTYYRIIVESGDYGTTPGDGTQAWDSGVLSSTSLTGPIGTPLPGVITYRVFVQVTETGGETSGWAYNTFTMAADSPASPYFTAIPANDPETGAPMVGLTIQGEDNQLTLNQATLGSGATTGWASNA